MSKAKAKAEPAAAGYWHYIGDGTRISGVPARDLTPAESALFDAAIRQVAATGTVLYSWAGVAVVEPVVVAVTVAPEYGVTATWEPGGSETKAEDVGGEDGAHV